MPTVYNKVTAGGQTLIDLSQDTVTDASHIVIGHTGHLADGTQVAGTGGGSGGTYQAKTGINPSESSQTITADTGYDALSSVQINAISSSYVGSGITRRSSTDLSANVATVTAPAGYYASAASKTVASGTEGTPTATKGTVSNHSVSVTPSVTNSAGYISGGTKTGTSITVSASELVSGSETKTANGTYDVTNLAQLIVNVSGSSGLVYETGTYTPASDIARPTISFANTHTTTPLLVTIIDTSAASSTTANSAEFFSYVDVYRYTNTGFPYNTSSVRYGVAHYYYRSSNGSTNGTNSVTYNSDNAGDSSTSYSRYYATESNFKPYCNSTSRYFRTGRTYKWIAVWAPTT